MNPDLPEIKAQLVELFMWIVEVCIQESPLHMNSQLGTQVVHSLLVPDWQTI